MNGLGILIIGALCVLAVLAVKYIVIPLCDRPEGLHRTDALDLTVPDDTGHIEIAHDGAYDTGSMYLPSDPYGPQVLARAQRYGDISGPPDGLLWAELTPAAEPASQGDLLVPSPVTDPAAAVEHVSPQTLPPPPVNHEAHETAVAVGAAIATTHKQIAEQEAARKAELEAEAEATSPWEDRGPFTNWLSADTLARGFPAIRLEDDGHDGDSDGPLSIPPEVLHEMDAGV